MEKMLKIDGNLAVQLKERRVITIAANEITEAAILRVAAYARVSTASSGQLNSYAAQNHYRIRRSCPRHSTMPFNTREWNGGAS